MSRIEEIPVEIIRANPYQPRQPCDDEELAGLVKSIKEQGGLIQPIVVRKSNSFYEIATGERRWRAYKRLGCKTIPALIRNLTDEQMLQTALVENLQRKDLNALEEASGYRKLQEKFDWTQEQVAEKVGKTRDYVAQRLRLLDFPPEVQDLVSRDTITPTHAELLASLKDPQLVKKSVGIVVEKKLTTRELESLIDCLLKQKEFRDFIPSVLELHTQKAETQWRSCAHALGDCCMLLGWKEEPADWIDGLRGKIEFVKKGDGWHPKVSPSLCGLCNRYLDHRTLEMENGVSCLYSLMYGAGAYRSKRCDAVDSSGLCLRWEYERFPRSASRYLEYVSDNGSQRKNIVEKIGGKFHINVKTFPLACALCSNFTFKAE